MLVSDILVLTPPGRVDASPAIAAARAGARGTLDLEYATDAAAIRAQLARLVQFTKDGFGVKIATQGALSLEDLLKASAGRLGWVLLASNETGLPASIKQLNHAGVDVLLEVVNIDEARQAAQLPIAGIVLKGCESSGRIGTESALLLVQRWRQEAARLSVNLPYWVQGAVGFRSIAACQVAGAKGVVLDNQLLLARETRLSDATRQRLESFDGTETLVLGEGIGAAYRFHNQPGSKTLDELEAALRAIETGSLPESQRPQAWRSAVRAAITTHPEEELILCGQDAALAQPFAQACVSVGGIVQHLAAESQRLIASAQRHQPLAAGSPLAVEHRTRYPLVQGTVPGDTDTLDFASAVAGQGGLPLVSLRSMNKTEATRYLQDAARRISESNWGVSLTAGVPANLLAQQIDAILAVRPAYTVLPGTVTDQVKKIEKRGIVVYRSVASPDNLRNLLRDGARRFVFDHEAARQSGATSGALLWEPLYDVLVDYIGTSQRGSELCVLFAGGVHDALSAAMVAAMAGCLVERGMKIGALLRSTKSATTEAPLQTSNNGRQRQATPKCAGSQSGAIDLAELYSAICDGATQLLGTDGAPAPDLAATEPPCDIAVVGMSCFYPGATSLGAYWQNILKKAVAVSEIPPTHWDWQLYYDPDPLAKDRIISKWGGFLSDIPFDPLKYGITPASMKSIEPLQLLLLEAVHHALVDAGYDRRPFCRERTAAVVGIGGGGSPMATAYGFRTCMRLIDNIPGMPVSSDAVLSNCEEVLPEWTEDSFPGFLFNVAVGRVANRFNLGGPNYAIDAACASSLAALQAAIRELSVGTSDVAIAMGADTVQTPFAYMAFSKTYALSRQGKSRPFDAEADGIVLSEGIGVLVLKRLADAERDGDRIYAVIKGVGSASDGKEKGLTAPNAAGQKRALSRAYAQARIEPSCVRLIEAHGTGTVVGDRTEAESMATVLTAAGAAPRSCAVGSVKSLIGHAKCAAGLAGMIKGILALDRKVLPPTLVETPNSAVQFEESPLYLNTEPRPWIQGDGQPRRAGVSAFGFGGTNFHVVLEEYRGDYLHQVPSASTPWPVELVVFRRRTRDELIAAVRECLQALAAGARPALVELAAAAWHANPRQADLPIVAIVASSLDDLQAKLSTIESVLQGSATTHRDPRGCYFAEQPGQAAGKLALVFPGQGSQYPNMLAELAIAFPKVREELDRAETATADKLPRPLGSYIYPPSVFDDDQRRANDSALADPTVSQPAIAAASLGMLRLLERLGLKAELAAGHSFGEYVALTAAGALPADAIYQLALKRGELVAKAAADATGGMVAINASADDTETLLAGLTDLWVANQNGPQQTVVAGTDQALSKLIERCQQQELRAVRLAVACGFHSPLVANASAELGTSLATQAWATPRQTVYANTTGQAYAGAPDEMVEQLTRHLSSPVRFQDEIEAMYSAGARTFVEVGPHNVLTGLIDNILGDRAHLAVATDLRGRNGLTQLAHAIGQLLVHGVDLCLDELYQDRVAHAFDLADLSRQTVAASHSPMTWMVNGVRCRPIDAPEPSLLGQRLPAKEGKPKAAATGPSRATESNPQGKVPMSSVIPAPAAPGNHNGKPHPSTNGDSHFWSAPATTPTTAPSAVPPAPAIAPAPVPSAAPVAPIAPVAAVPPAIVPTLPNIAPSDAATQVVLRYQDLMEKFLEAQRTVMLTYLQGPTAPAAPVAPSQASFVPVAVAPTPISAPPFASAAPMAPPTTPPIALSPSLNGTSRWQNLSHENFPAMSAAATVEAPPAPLQTPTANAPAAKGAPAQLDFDELRDRLLELVSKRTGYPLAMLDLDLDLEAELGIDSIKRVEILSTLAESLTSVSSDLESKIVLEKLTVIRTLGGILDYLRSALADNSEDTAAAGAEESDEFADEEIDDAPSETGSPSQLEVQRAVIHLTDVPLDAEAGTSISGGAALITDDGRGIAQKLAARLHADGLKTALVRMVAGGQPQLVDGILSGDLTDLATVKRLLALAREALGPIAGLIHLLPLAQASPEVAPAARAYRETKALYLLAQQLETDLREIANKNKNAALLAATSLGGGLGFDDPTAHELPDEYFAGHGGVIGLAKCIAQEWNDVLVRVVDFDPAAAADQIVEHLLSEIADRRGPAEIGYLDGRRVTWQLGQAALDDAEPVEPAPLDKGTKIVITGGARGITAAIAVELARRYQPTLIVAGRSPLPPETESPQTVGLVEPGELKAALIQHLGNGKPPRPAEVEKAYQRLLREREIRDNLASMRAAGATVEYHSVDVRDEQAVARLLEDVYARHGRIDGVLHGAGVIEDKLLRDKTPESFDRVYRTKVDSAYSLCRHLRLDELKFLVFFASLASRYGNRGQSDYAAANEVLSKLAAQLDRQLSARVFSVAWGPWSGVGMVAELEPHLTRRGLKLISPETGPAFLIDELLLGRKGTAEIVVAGGAERLVAPADAAG
ncbi:MAG: SDR family NAD(P)-dependent oxidoreductase [Pirellulales bacterium]|nr:SDR family NAD(P)-dependent oxidoreductase [Pirellulales bacterium]